MCDLVYDELSLYLISVDATYVNGEWSIVCNREKMEKRQRMQERE